MSDATPPVPPTPGSAPPPPPGATKKPIWKRWWFWVAAVVLLLIIASAAGGGGTASNSASGSPTGAPPSSHETPTKTHTPPPSTQSEAPPVPAANTIENGTWVVGADIKPGTYRTVDPGGGCYWERVKNFSGGLSSIIANGNAVGGPIIVSIAKTDKGFTSQGCGTWSDDLKTPSTQSRTAFDDGMYLVGVDIAPGTYRVDAKNGCYWERDRDFSGNLNSIIANDNTKGSTIVQIAGSDAGFLSNGCGHWTKV